MNAHVLEVSVQGSFVFGLRCWSPPGHAEQGLAKRSPYIGQEMEEERPGVPEPLLRAPVDNQNISHQTQPLKAATTCQ